MEPGAAPFRATAVGDVFVGSGRFTMKGCRLVAGAGAPATAQLVDADGTVLADLAAIAGAVDDCHTPILAQGKVHLQALVGAGAIVNVFIL